MTSELPRIGVIGVGSMGQNHARIFNSMAQIEFVGVFDPEPEALQRIHNAYGCGTYSDLEELLDAVDAVSIASPTVLHAEHGICALRKGVHVLIEKPMATSKAEAESLIEEAKRAQKILHVGHIERFNPVIGQLKNILSSAPHSIHGLSARRMSALSSRITDIDVVMDLMIHDIDIALYLREGCAIARIDAYGVDGNYVTALAEFDDGGIASFTASRITQKKIRELQISTDDGLFEIDYLDQKLHRHRQRNSPQVIGAAGSGSYILDESIERILVRPAEPLVLEIEAFVAAIAGKNNLGVTGEEAMRALQVGWQIQDKLQDTVRERAG